MAQKAVKKFHTGTVRRTVRITASKDAVWQNISNIAGLAQWVQGVKKTVYLSKKRRGVGAIRLITFADGSRVEEHIVTWDNGEGFTYVATKGLPLRVYVASITVKAETKNLTVITWQSYLCSEKMSARQFQDFVAFMGVFYKESLKSLKVCLEKKTK